MKIRTVATVVAGLGLGLLVYTQLIAAPTAGEAKAQIGQSAPDFSLKDSFGKTFSLSEFKDRIVVLEWMNKDCPFVVEAHNKKRVMQNTYAKFAGKGVIWLGIDTTHGRQVEHNRIWAAEAGLAYPILFDEEGKVGRAYGATNTPHMFVIDKAGKLAYMGAIDDKGEVNYVEKAIKELLDDKTVSTPKTPPYGCNVKYPPAP
ncbi:MAG: redoxin domain-containing protein [Phycisphaerales bacterium]|nr:redoxin domain-containing protein [Phycisphaerales bacterium]